MLTGMLAGSLTLADGYKFVIRVDTGIGDAIVWEFSGAVDDSAEAKPVPVGPAPIPTPEPQASESSLANTGGQGSAFYLGIMFAMAGIAVLILRKRHFVS